MPAKKRHQYAVQLSGMTDRAKSAAKNKKLRLEVATQCYHMAMSAEEQQDRDNGAANTGGAQQVANEIRAAFNLPEKK